MESTSLKNSSQNFGENENICVCGPQLHGIFSSEFSSETNSAIDVQECNLRKMSCMPETVIKRHHRKYDAAEDVSPPDETNAFQRTGRHVRTGETVLKDAPGYLQECVPIETPYRLEKKLRRPSIKKVAEYKTFKLHEINELEVSGSSELSEGYVLDLSTSATRFRLHDPLLTDQIDPKPSTSECGSSDKTRNSEHSSVASRRYEEILKPHECETCRKRFCTKFELMRHTRVHTGEKPYECEICTRRFNRKFALKTHLLTHTGERRFECEICHQKFKRKHHLNRHLSVHMVETPQ